MGAAGQAVVLLGFVLVALAAGGLGSLATVPAVPGWYAGLAKPSWTPPSWLFGPVWTLLYLTMGVAAWLVWREAGGVRAAGLPLTIWLVQLALNALWSFLFFGLRQPGWAFVEVVVLWLAILATVAACWRISPTAGAVLLPYLLWVSYAAALNGALWWMNRARVA
jgi:translocator protein